MNFKTDNKKEEAPKPKKVLDKWEKKDLQIRMAQAVNLAQNEMLRIEEYCVVNETYRNELMLRSKAYYNVLTILQHEVTE